MDFIHCNSCSHSPVFQEKRRYFITNCGHVVCYNCTRRMSDEICVVCKCKCRLNEINNESKEEIKVLFKDPLQMLQESLRTFEKNLQWQKSQQRNYFGQIGKMYKNIEGLSSEISNLTKTLQILKNENTQLKSQLLQMRQNQQQEQCGFAFNGGRTPPSATISTIFGQQRETPSYQRVQTNINLITSQAPVIERIDNSTNNMNSHNNNYSTTKENYETNRYSQFFHNRNTTPNSNLNAFNTHPRPEIVSRLQNFHGINVRTPPSSAASSGYPNYRR